MEAHAKTQELLVDLLTMIGQSDIALWELRESVLYPKLSRDFVDMLKNLNKKKEEQVSSRFSTNKMFHEKLDEMVSRARKTKLDGVLDYTQWRRNKRGKQPVNSSCGFQILHLSLQDKIHTFLLNILHVYVYLICTARS